MNPSDWTTASNANLLDLVIGFFMPLAVSLVMRPGWANWFRSLCTAFLCVAVALLKCYTMGLLKPSDILHSILVVMLMCYSIHRNFWKPIGVSGAIESATSPAPTSEKKDESQ